MLHVSRSNSRHLLRTLSRPFISNAYCSYTQFEPIKFNGVFDYFDHLLRRCTNSKQSTQIHAQIVHFGGISIVFLCTRLISIYSRFELLTDARKVFENVSIESLSNTSIWNSMLRANVTNGECRETLKVYTRMRKIGVSADEFTFPLVIRACANVSDLNLCGVVHCYALVTGLQDNIYVANELLSAYGRLGEMGIAHQVFDEMLVRNLISWNTMVSNFAFNYDCNNAFEMFKRMEFEGWEPNSVTWTSLLSSHARCCRYQETLNLYNLMRKKDIKATAESLSVVVSVCNDSDVFDKGREIHGYVITAGFDNYLFAKNSLLCMYGKLGDLKAAEKLFSEIKAKNLVSWNALISSYVEVGLCDEAFSTFLKLEKLEKLKKSEKNLVRNVISWSAIITGFASDGRSNESLNLFRKMLLAKVRPNVVTISSILSVCAGLSTIVLGKEIHGYIIRNLMEGNNLLVSNGLINMYAKCGSLNEAYKTFNNIKIKDLCSWNTMIKGYGMHGFGKNALKIFKQMIKNGYKPDGVTFVSLLSACSHNGLVNEGRVLFHQMKSDFGVDPRIEHYACMVDLFGRAGLFQEANEIAEKMPIEPNVCVYGALLNSSRMHKNVNWDKGLVCKMLDNSCGSGNYMLLSNIYAQIGQWEDSAKVRVSARVRGLTKTPGQSWIELDKRVHMFTAGEFVENEMMEVWNLIKILSFEMKIFGLQDAEVETIALEDSYG